MYLLTVRWQVIHVQNCDDEITMLDKQAGDWTVTITQRIYKTAEQLLSYSYRDRPRIVDVCYICFNLFIATLKPQSNGPLYSNTVIGTLAVDGCYIWYSEEGPGRAGAPPSPGPLLGVPNVKAHPMHPWTANVPNSYCLMWHYNCIWTLKG